MSGIAALWNWSQPDVSVIRLYAMAAAQRHRGPNGHGYAVWAQRDATPAVWRGGNETVPSTWQGGLWLGLANNWMGVQDRRAAARQPMTHDGQRYWLVYSGEIYNFVELRDELRGEGHVFTSASDAEVLLALWRRFGPEALHRLRGMFAFLLYDSESQTLWAGRDRFGMKPLYYAPLPGDTGILLASELRGIHGAGLLPRQWEEGAVRAFLAAGVGQVGEGTTFFQGVYELPPGCLLEMRPGERTLHRYYHLPPIDHPDLGQEALPELRERILDSVRLHLRSAPEVGLALSGGLDSANLALALGELLGWRVSDFRAFTMGTLGGEEMERAQLVAEQVGVQHFIAHLPPSVALSDLADMIVACELPDPAWHLLMPYLLARYVAAEHPVAVLLGGYGGDALFSAYPWFVPQVERAMARAVGPDGAAALSALYYRRPPLPPERLRALGQSHTSRRGWVEAFEGGALAALGLSVDEVLTWDALGYFLDDGGEWSTLRDHEICRRDLPSLLHREDRLGMWFSIESRMPYLDHLLVEFVGRLSPTFLMAEGYLKYPLRVLFRTLPDTLRLRVAKPATGMQVGITREPLIRAILSHRESFPLPLHEFLLHSLDRQALWRFFQVAVLSTSGTREAAAAWADGNAYAVSY